MSLGSGGCWVLTRAVVVGCVGGMVTGAGVTYLTYPTSLVYSTDLVYPTNLVYEGSVNTRWS